MTNEEYRQEIGRRITQARNAARLSPAQLAAKTGIKKSTLSNWELGIRMPRGPEEIWLIAKATGVSASYIGCLDNDASTLDPRNPWLPPGSDSLPSPFKQAVALRIEHYLAIVAAMPPGAVALFKAPTAHDLLEWEAHVDTLTSPSVVGNAPSGADCHEHAMDS